MKKTLLLLGLVTSAFIFQTTLLQFMTVFGTTINLILVMFVMIALQTNEITGSLIGLGLGCLMDLFYGQFFGINMLLFFTIGFIVGSISKDVYQLNFSADVLFVILATLYYHGTFLLINYFLRIDTVAISYLIKPLIIEMGLNILIVYPLYKIKHYLIRQVKI